jgi:hypothetical protein
MNRKSHAFLVAALLILIGLPGQVIGQTGTENTLPEHAFDFWLGEWDLTWQNEDGSTASGKNRVCRILDGHVIEENFEVLTGDMAGYVGKSYSVYNSQTGEWKKTWVDNGGAYLDFTGDIDGGNRIFQRTAITSNGNRFLQRMVFYDITEDSPSWEWQRSEDDGETWQLMWRIQYRRALVE